MGRITKIDWCDSSWNPVTGCLHGCKYCYARRIAERFGGQTITGHDHLYILDKPAKRENGTITPYPYGFDPTFHRYKMDEPQRWKKPRNIFVCSMADLFGEWVPESWIMEVFNACDEAPQHRFLFLTKNPARYLDLSGRGLLPRKDNFWYGSTVTCEESPFFRSTYHNCFLSIEPMLGDFAGFYPEGDGIEWAIIGAETGNRQGKVLPKKGWIENVTYWARSNKIPVFMKGTVCGLMGDDFVQDFPWET